MNRPSVTKKAVVLSTEPGKPQRKRAAGTDAKSESVIPETLVPNESYLLLQSLRVHQIELEMQNEELRRAHGELEESRARYFDLYDLAPVGYLTLSKYGLILEANISAAAVLGMARTALAKQPFTRFIFPEDLDIYHLHRKQCLEPGIRQSWEMRLNGPGGNPFWAHLQAASARDGELWITVDTSRVCHTFAEEAKTTTFQKEHAILRQQVSTREREILLLVGVGFTSKKIAEQLGIRINTVEVHRANLMRKLKATNAAILVRWAVIAEQM